MLTTIFFDAGNTLLFADLSKTLKALRDAGYDPTVAQLYAAESAAKRRLDAAMFTRRPGSGVDHDFWRVYYTFLCDRLGAPAEVIPACIDATRRSANWSQVLPETRGVLLELRRRGLRLGVISNSDGRIRNILEAVGLGDCFETFTDSGNVKIEKPDVGIFRHALAALDAKPDSSAYVGDSYSIDYQGAEAAGMRAILMDTANVYRDTPYLRITALRELLGML